MKRQPLTTPRGDDTIRRSIRMHSDGGMSAFIPFLPAYYPDRASFFRSLEELDAGGAAVIEIGIPFSDPSADGPVIEAAGLVALKNDATIGNLLRDLRRRRAAGKAPAAALVLMGYMNPFYSYGFEKLADDAAAAGVSGLIIADLPFHEDEEIRGILDGRGLALVPLVAPNTEARRMARCSMDKGRGGFVYLVSAPATTGTYKTTAEAAQQLSAAIDRVREYAPDLPLAIGFGISDPRQLEKQGLRPDAVIVGTALVRHINEGGTAAGFISRWNKRAANMTKKTTSSKSKSKVKNKKETVK